MGKRKTTEEFIEQAKKVHKNKYDYSVTEYIRNNNNVNIICLIHGVFTQLPIHHLKGHGCKKCGFNSQRELKQKSFENFVNESNAIHGIYTYDKVKYINNQTLIEINCPFHGSFFQTPGNHLKGQGCSDCSKYGRKSKEVLLNKFKEVHGDKYDYSNMDFVNFHKKIEIICPKHGSFWQTPSNHYFSKQNCPNCSNRVSYLEKKWLDSLGVTNRQSKIKIGDRYFWPDGVDFSNKTIYEFYGDFWHGNPKKYKSNHPFIGGLTMGDIYKKTMDREQLFKDNGYSVVSVWESDFNEFNY